MSRRMAAAIGRLWRDRSGVIAILTAFGALVLVGFTGLAIDVATWELTQHKMQGAADAAALAGSIADYASQNVTDAVDAVAASYGFANAPGGATVTVSYPNSGAEVQVVISQPQPRYFSRVFLASAPTVTVQATANLPTGQGEACIMALGSSGQIATDDATFSGSTTVDLSNCDLYNNSPDSTSTQLGGSAILGVRNMFLAGGYTVSGNATLSLSGTAATYVQPAINPYAGTQIPSYSGCSQTNYTLNPNTLATISAGATPYVFCGDTDIKGNLTLGPGIYVIDNGSFTAESQATITGTGVTIILTGTSIGTMTINGGATVTLSAPTSGATAGIALWIDQSAPNANTDNLNGGSGQNINGVIYMPSQNVTFNGGTSGTTSCLQLIAQSVTFLGNSSSYITQSGCSTLGIPIKNPPLPPTLAS